MMLCKADFEELFPEDFKAEHGPVPQHEAEVPGTACLARWEDDGGRPTPAFDASRPATCRIPQPGSIRPDRARDTGLAGMMSPVAAYAAAWVMLSGYRVAATN